jgi:hypothetical protein
VTSGKSSLKNICQQRTTNIFPIGVHANIIVSIEHFEPTAVLVRSKSKWYIVKE